MDNQHQWNLRYLSNVDYYRVGKWHQWPSKQWIGKCYSHNEWEKCKWGPVSIYNYQDIQIADW